MLVFLVACRGPFDPVYVQVKNPNTERSAVARRG